MTPDEIKEVQVKIDKAAEAVIHVQEKFVALEKSGINAVDFASMKDAATEASKLFEEAQTARLKFEAENKERVEGLERAIANMGTGKNELELAPEHVKASYDYMRKGTPIPKETIEVICNDVAEKGLFFCDDIDRQVHIKSLVEGSNPRGGFFVTPDASGRIISRVFETSAMRSIASIITTTSNEVTVIIDDDEASVQTGVGEVTARTETDTADIGEKSIPIHEISAFPFISQRMLDDAGFDIVGWHNGKVSRKVSRTENTWSVTGDGSQKWEGILSLPAWDTAGVYERDAIEQYTSTGTSALLDSGVDFMNLQNSLIEEYQAGAVWVVKRPTWGSITQLRDGNGNFLLNPFMMKDGTDQILLGKPVMLFNDMPTIAASSLSVAYGDFSVSYTIADRFGIRVLRDELTNKPFIGFYTTKRSGGAVTSFEGYKIMKTKA
jgi:HK97 family phage major capsid protein